MSGNTFGTLFSVTNFGESHGPAIGCVIDGCPPGMPLSEADIQPDLDRRRPGTSKFVTQRKVRVPVTPEQQAKLTGPVRIEYRELPENGGQLIAQATSAIQ